MVVLTVCSIAKSGPYWKFFSTDGRSGHMNGQRERPCAERSPCVPVDQPRSCVTTISVPSARSRKRKVVTCCASRALAHEHGRMAIFAHGPVRLGIDPAGPAPFADEQLFDPCLDGLLPLALLHRFGKLREDLFTDVHLGRAALQILRHHVQHKAVRLAVSRVVGHGRVVLKVKVVHHAAAVHLHAIPARLPMIAGGRIRPAHAVKNALEEIADFRLRIICLPEGQNVRFAPQERGDALLCVHECSSCRQWLCSTVMTEPSLSSRK